MSDKYLNLMFDAVLVLPPLLLFLAWVSWWKRGGEKRGPKWRVALRDIALVGATTEFIAFWLLFISLQNVLITDASRGFEIWGIWIEVALVSSLVFILLAIAGKGVGRILTILSCITLLPGLLIINP